VQTARPALCRRSFSIQQVTEGECGEYNSLRKVEYKRDTCGK
jgi:hypothetical protein